MKNYAEILQATLALPPSERCELAEALWESLDDEPNSSEPAIELSAAWREEIARRSAEYDAGTMKPVRWEQMWSRARRLAGNDEQTDRSAGP